MISYRCTYNAGTGHQCQRIASRKIKGQWLCLAHLNGSDPVHNVSNYIVSNYSIHPNGYLGSSSPDHEVRKRYHREYRRRYRADPAHKRHTWPLTIEIKLKKHCAQSLWRVGSYQTFDRKNHDYHCEICCEQIEVIAHNPEVAREPKVKGGYVNGKFAIKGTIYIVFAEHKCHGFESSKVEYVNCYRCGKLGTQHTITSNRPLSGDYGDKLCIDCYRVMRPFWAKVYEEKKLYDLLMELKSEMRKAGIHPNVKALDRYWWMRVYEYRDTWWYSKNRKSQIW